MSFYFFFFTRMAHMPDQPVFRRLSHQQRQVRPSKNGDIRKLLDYINIVKPEHQLLFLVYVVSCFIEDIPHPIAIFHGPQGTAKSTSCRILKRIIDPSKIDVLSFPKNETELVQQLSHHWLLAYDNVSLLPDWASDALCRAVTGGGFSKRELYTDDEDVIYYFRRCIVLNGINLASNKPDVLDRSLLFALEPIDPAKRRTENELWKNFEQDLPVILGGILDSLSKALQILPTVKLVGFPRMADFAEKGCAIATALGYTQDEFERAYAANRNEHNESVVQEDIVASAIVKFMEDKNVWDDHPQALYDDLLAMYGERRPKNFPADHTRLSRHLNTITSNLSAVGLQIESYKDSKGKRGRYIKITNANKPASQPSLDFDHVLSEATNDERQEVQGDSKELSHPASQEEVRDASDTNDDDSEENSSPPLGDDEIPSDDEHSDVVDAIVVEPTQQVPEKEAHLEQSDASDGNSEITKPLSAFQKIMQPRT
jgi:hypothetical protein